MVTNRDYPLLIYDRKKMEIDNLKKENAELKIKIKLSQERLERRHSDISSLKDKVNELTKAANYYMRMQRAILANPILQGEWTRFCSFLKMAEVDMESDDAEL